jgi:fluoride exporter
MDDRTVPIDPDLAPADSSRPLDARSRSARHRRTTRLDVLAAIALGGMLGALARFELAEALPTAPGRFPWATFWANVSGSFALGFALILLLERFPPTRYVRPFLATGVMGAYTTMSTFLVETAVLIKDGHVATGLLYGLGTVAAGVILGYAGIVTARLTPARHRHDRPQERP